MTESSPVPPGLHDRGTRLWAALGRPLDSPAGHLALEACRLADRLDELDSVIAGKGVLNLMQFRLDLDFDDVARVEVKFQNVLAEARQQAATFAAVLAKLGIEDAPANPGSNEGASPLAAVLALVQPGAKPAGRPSKG